MQYGRRRFSPSGIFCCIFSFLNAILPTTMKKVLYSILPTLFLVMSALSVNAQCHAGFTWEQIPGTLQIHFQNTSTSENDIISNQWNFGDGHEGDGINPNHTYPEPGTYLVCLIIHDNEGCASDVCHEVTVEPLQSECDASFTWEQIPGTLQIHFNSTSISQYDIVSYIWHFGDGDEGDDNDPYHTYDEPGNYLVCLIIEDNEGCVSDVCHEVTVEGISSECNASFIWEQFNGTLEVDFASTSTSEHDITSFIWHFGDGHNGDGPNPSHTYSEPGTYLVCLIITNEAGCVSDVCHEVHVEEPEGPCHADFTWDLIPGSLGVHFFSQSTSEHDIISYHWTFGDGDDSNDQNPGHEYDEPGTYLVCLRIEDNTGCVSEICHEVTVGEEEGCHAQFTWEQIPGTLQIHFNSTSTSPNDIVSYVWHFGDGDEGDGNDPYHTYDEPGTYLVCLIITDSEGCVSDVCHEIHVGEPEGPCHAAFTWDLIPGSLGVHFFSQSTSEHDIISYHWTFGDGHDSKDQNPGHEYDEPGTYVVCLRIEDNTGCVSEICHEVTVGQEEGCHAQFTWEQIPGTLQIHFNSTSTSQNDIVTYSWNFGDGHFGDGNDPYHTYEHPGVYVVCLLIVDAEGCASDVCHEVHVEAPEGPCHAAFTWDLIPGSFGVHFFSQSTSEHDIISYHWTFGDGHDSNDQNPGHEYDQPGTYVVCLRIEDNTGCVSEICHEVTIGQEEGCHAQFTWEQIPGTQQIHFNSTSTSPNDIILYSWNFGDGHFGDGNDPYHTYEVPGVYVVCLLIVDSDSCASDICHEIHVGEPEEEECNASFNFETNEEGVVFFNNTSTGTTEHTTWLWVFDDGHMSDNENPHHTYDEPGIYTVCLYISDETNGCVDSFCLTIAYDLGWEESHYDELPANARSVIYASSSLNVESKIIKYTNPVSEDVQIEYYLDTESDVRFELYDLTGNRLMTDLTKMQVTGAHQKMIDISAFHPGLYILSMTSGAERKTMPLTISR
jgi:PKD repeat protein